MIESALGQLVLGLAALIGMLAGLLGIFVTRYEYVALSKRVRELERRHPEE